MEGSINAMYQINQINQINQIKRLGTAGERSSPAKNQHNSNGKLYLPAGVIGWDLPVHA